jgi:RNA polymerase sigma factor (sigma-70 family)
MNVMDRVSGQPDLLYVGATDPLRLFFEDVAHLPIIEGKRDYLPLTRRIRRGEIFASLECDSPAHTYAAIVRSLAKNLKLLETQRRTRSRPPLDVRTLGEEIEGFFDDPGIEIPSSLEKCLGKPKRNLDEATEAFEDLGWHCFYTLSLLPPTHRAIYPQLNYDEDVNDYFFRISYETPEALTQLTEGTLRYVINNAVNYVGRGIPFLDLVQEGVLGLQIAAAKYDERKGHFQQYAAAWIRQRIDRYISDNVGIIRIPVHMRETMAKYNDELDSIDLDISQEDEPIDLENQATDPGDAKKQLEWRRRFLVATAAHYSLERTRLAARDEEGNLLGFEDILACADYDDYVEAQIELQSSALRLHEVMERRRLSIGERNWEIMMLRLGFVDGEERTLEEAAKPFGLTRERVRQIEAKFLTSLRHPSVKRSLDSYKSSPLRTGSFPTPLVVPSYLNELLIAPEATDSQEDKAAIQKLIDRYVERGRPKVWDIRRLRGRKALFREVLLELSKPTHYSIIHQMALERVPAGLQFSKESTYTTLFYGNRVFRSYSNAVFGLVEWPVEATTVDGEVIFDLCPAPLLPPNTHVGAFFDSIEYGRQLLARRRFSADEFWAEMTKWAGQGAVTTDPQGAFDAWYGAGLISRVQFAATNGAALNLTAPVEASLSELRSHCLSALCRRVARMPEWLLAVASLGRPTLPALQATLYGNVRDAYDAETRLALLTALGAVRRVGNEWRLTDDGRAVLTSFPELELPDTPDEGADEEEEDDMLFELELYEFDL